MFVRLIGGLSRGFSFLPMLAVGSAILGYIGYLHISKSLLKKDLLAAEASVIIYEGEIDKHISEVGRRAKVINDLKSVIEREKQEHKLTLDLVQRLETNNNKLWANKNDLIAKVKKYQTDNVGGCLNEEVSNDIIDTINGEL